MKPIMYVDMDGVICDYPAAFAAAVKENPSIQYPQSVPGFFLALPPIADAVESVNWLRDRFDTYILTAPSTRNPHCYSEKRIWIEDHFGYEFTKRLIISPNKGLSKGDYLIDDHADGRGQDQFEGKLILFGTDEFPDWKSVISFLDQDDKT